MLGLSLGNPETSGINLETVKIYVYKTFFFVEANRQITGINSKIKIDRKNYDILQLDKEQPMPPNPERKISCCVLLGIIPILSKHYLLIVETCKSVCSIGDKTVYQIQRVDLIAFEADEALDRNQDGNLTEKSIKITEQNSKIAGYIIYLKTYLLTEGYYFAFKYDLSLSRSAHALGCPSKKKFLWNLNISKTLAKLTDGRWFVGLIQGSIKNFKMPIEGTSTFLEYVLITRRSWTKGGTRFNSRGIDLKGNVANFCQTEQLLFAGNQCFSHLQIRGSVPLFWKQTGLYGQVEFCKGKQENSLSYEKHMKKIIRNYNKILCINLLCKEKEGEIDLTLYYEKLVKDSNMKEVKYEYFDVHCASTGQRFDRCNYLVDKIHGINNYFGFYREDVDQKIVLSLQQGVIRVNCLDNLDRTNLIQSKIAYYVLTNILQSLGFDLSLLVNSPSIVTAADNSNNSSILIIHLKNVWADNGDMISKHYTGTGSTHTNVTRTGKRNFTGLVDHSFKTCKRLYQQFVDDNQKQEVIDILLGEHTETVNLSEIEDRLKAFPEEEESSDQMTNSAVENW